MWYDYWKEQKYRAQLEYALLFLQLLMLGFCFWMTADGYQTKPINQELDIALDTMGILISVLMYLSIVRSGAREKLDWLFMNIIITCSVYMCADSAFWMVNGVPRLVIWNILVNLVYNVCPVIMTMLFWLFLGVMIGSDNRYYRRASWFMEALSLCCILFLLGNLAGGYYYRISMETGIYSRAFLYRYYMFAPLTAVMSCFAYILQSRLVLTDRMILLLYPMLPFLNILFRLVNVDSELLAVEIFCAVMFFYTNLYVRRERENMLRSQALATTRLRAMQLQINPHFFYNTLNSIAGLCETAPDEAQEMIYLLSDYLRDNFTDIARPSMIPIRVELQHLGHYLAIEQIRFPDIQVQYHIEEENFVIPAMTLQPLVENAIKHGICRKREQAGTITIETGRTEDAWIVYVRDDGVGFDTSAAVEHHIGIDNVRTRLALLCKGSLEIESRPGQGTVCRVNLPMEEQ